MDRVTLMEFAICWDGFGRFERMIWFFTPLNRQVKSSNLAKKKKILFGYEPGVRSIPWIRSAHLERSEALGRISGWYLCRLTGRFTTGLVAMVAGQQGKMRQYVNSFTLEISRLYFHHVCGAEIKPHSRPDRNRLGKNGGISGKKAHLSWTYMLPERLILRNKTYRQHKCRKGKKKYLVTYLLSKCNTGVYLWQDWRAGIMNGSSEVI